MAQTIKLKRSSVSGNTPSTSDLELGEVAINTYDGKMFIKKNDGSDSIVEIGGSSGTVTDAFKTIAVSGQTSVVADSATDTLTLVAGTNMSITTNAGGDTITFASTGSSGSATFLGLSDSPANFSGAAGKFLKVNSSANSIEFDTLNFDDLGTTPTTIAGYGITDALQLGTSATTALAGNTSIPTALTDLSISDGSSGQVLQTDGSGNFSFVNQTGGNSFGTIAVSGQSNVVADQGSDTLTLVAGSNVTLTTNASGDSVTIASSGGGSSPADAIFEEYQFNATGGQTTFTGSDNNSQTLSYTADAIQVFLNGVFLDPAVDYTATNGTSIVLSETVDANDYLQVIAYKKKISDGQTTVDTFSGNGSTTAFTLSLNPGDENNTRVFIDGVYQSKSNYAVSGTTLTFSTAPPNGTAVEVEIGNRVVTLDTTASIDLPDNVKLRLGTDQDLQIYHDGSNGFINNTTGDLYIQDSNGSIRIRPKTGENGINVLADSSVELYYDNNKKFETTSTGATITGRLIVDEGVASAQPLQIGSSSSTQYTLQRWITSSHSGTEAYIIAYGASHSSEAGNFAIKNIEANSDIFFELANNVKPLRLTSTGASFQGTITNTGTISTNTHLDFTGSGGYVSTTGLYALRFRTNNTEALRLTSGQDAVFAGTISSGAITSSGASSGRYTGLEVVNTTNAAGTETAIGLGVVSASNSACDVKLVANRVAANFGSDFYIEQTDSSGSQQETLRITEAGNASFAGTISSGAITSSGNLDFTSTTSVIRNQQDNSGQIGISVKNSSSTERAVRWDAANNTNGAWRATTNGAADLGLTNKIWNNLFVNTIKVGTSNLEVIDSARNITSHDITTDGVIRSTNNANVDGPNFNVSTTNKDNAEYAYRVDRSGSVVGGIRLDGRVNGQTIEVGGTTVLSSGRNLQNVVNATISGDMTITNHAAINNFTLSADVALGVRGHGTSGSQYIFSAQDSGGSTKFYVRDDGVTVHQGSGYLYAASSGVSFYSQNSSVFRGAISNDQGDLNLADHVNISSGTLKIAGTTVIDASRNLTNIADITASGDIDISGTSKIHLSGGAGTDYLEFDDDSGSYASSTNVAVFASKSDIVLRTNTNDGGGGNFTISTGESSPTTLLFINKSTGNVGIGTGSSASFRLHVKTAVDNSVSQGLAIERSANSDRGYINYQGGAFRFVATDGDPLRFGHVSNADRVSIDTSGNLLVGTTNTTWQTQAGFRYFAGNSLIVTRSANEVMSLNRLSDNGDVLLLRKDGGTGGKLGVAAGPVAYMVFNDTTSNNVAALKGTSARILPSTNAGADKDATMGLGSSSARFKDLFLSEGIFLGGTSTSHQLDDYEEGTWTPQIDFGGGNTGITYSGNPVGRYTKIGRMVYLSFSIQLSNKGSSTGGVTVLGAPFANYTSVQNNAGTVICEQNGVNWPQNGVYGMVWTDSKIYIRQQGTTGYIAVSNANFSNTTRIFGMMVYETS